MANRTVSLHCAPTTDLPPSLADLLQMSAPMLEQPERFTEAERRALALAIAQAAPEQTESDDIDDNSGICVEVTVRIW